MQHPAPRHLAPKHGALSTKHAALLLLLFVASLPAVTTRIYSSDEIQYFAYLRSLWFDHDLLFENEYQYFYDRDVARSEGFHETFLERKTETGRRRNYGTIGCALLWSPFYAVGHGVAKVSGAAADGFSKPYVAAVAYGSAVYGFLAIVLAILCAARLGHDGFVAGLAVWFGTPLLFYMYVAPVFSHACSAFAVALFIYVWLRVRETWSTGGFVALAAAGALMAMVREQDSFFVAGPALDFVAGLLTQVSGIGYRVSDVWRRVLAAAVTFALVFTPQAISYWLLNGHIGPHSSVANKMNWAAPHAWQVLFSPQHGFFVWTPLALLALAALFVPPNHLRQGYGGQEGGSYGNPDQNPVASGFSRNRVFVCLLLMVALQIYVGGSVESWTVAGAFGQRRFIALSAILVIGVTHLRSSLPPRAWVGKVLTAIVILAVYWNLAVSAEFATELMDRQKLEPRKNAYDAFVTLPRMAPSLAYRYLFDRASFYKPRG